MPYVVRDTKNRIIGLELQPSPSHSEELPWNHPEIHDFFAYLSSADEAHGLLSTPHFITLRLIEDLIDFVTESKAAHFRQDETVGSI